MVKKLLLFIPIFLLLLIPTNVFALPTDTELGLYNWPCTGSAFNLGSFAWYYGDFPFYGWNGNGSTSSCPYNSQFYSSEFSVFVNTANGNFNQNSGRGRYALRFNLNRTLYNGATYNVVVKLIGSDLTYYFNGVSSIDNGRVDSTTLTCRSATECNLNAEITMSSDTSELVLNINSPSEGLNGYYFNDLTLELFYPQISMISGPQTDTTGIENNQQTIINQNQTEINQNNTIINQNSDMLQKQQETNELLEQQQESQQVCNNYDNNSIFTSGSYLLSTGATGQDNRYGITNFIKISSTSKLKMITSASTFGGSSLCFYNINKDLISCITNTSLIQDNYINIPQNSDYVRFSINTALNKPQFEICNNGNQALSDDINNLNDTLNSTDTPNTNEDIEDMEDMLASDTPISDLITMPLTLMHAYINGINATCSPVNLGTLYGTTLTIPCLNLEQKLGSDLWSKIDVLFSIFMCYNIGMLFITAFSGITSLRDDFDSLYVPKHADTGYQPKHGGGS